jgi:hypothetical protein
MILELDGVVGLKKDVADGVLSRVGKSATNVPFRLSLEELMRYRGHNTGTVAITAVSTSSSPVGHRTEQLTSVGYDFMAPFAFYVADKGMSADLGS